MNHETAVPLIGDLLHGRLSGRIKNEILSHVTGCDECRSLSETYAVLSDVWNDESLKHPPSELIVQYAIAEDALDEGVRGRVAAHVLDCELCANEVEATGLAETELAKEAAPTMRRPTDASDRRWLLAPAIAAAVVLVLLSYPTYLGLFEVPRIKNRLTVLEAETVNVGETAWSGPVEPLYLQSPLRGADAELPFVELAPGQPYVTFAIAPGMLEEYAGAQIVHFEISDAAGRSTWSWNLGENELRSRVEGDVVWFLVSEAALPTGRLMLSVSREPGSAAPVFEAPFVVNRSD